MVSRLGHHFMGAAQTINGHPNFPGHLCMPVGFLGHHFILGHLVPNGLHMCVNWAIGFVWLSFRMFMLSGNQNFLARPLLLALLFRPYLAASFLRKEKSLATAPSPPTHNTTQCRAAEERMWSSWAIEYIYISGRPAKKNRLKSPICHYGQIGVEED